MIELVLAAAIASAAPSAPPRDAALRPRPVAGAGLAPATVLARYAAALAAHRTPAVLSFEYSIDQAGAHDLQQTHRVFRSNTSERDELLSVDGKRLAPPTIHIFLGRRNRYAFEALAPRPEAYTFRFIGNVRDGRHLDAVFKTTAVTPADATVSQVTIDGASFLPLTIRFTTRAHAGRGIVTFGRVQKYWMVITATANATYAKTAAVEHLTFYRYRFPPALAPSTFSKPRPLPSFRPAPL